MTTLLARMREVAEGRAAEVAVEVADERLTYAALWGRVRRLAGELRARGVGPETVVGLLMERSLELVVGVLGVLEAGGAYLPLEPEHPDDRLGLLLRDAGARVVLATPGQAERLRGGDVVVADASWAGETAGWGPLPDGRQAAYVIYTSGSTGRPKGVVVPHAGIANRVEWTVETHGLGSDDAVLQKTPLGFDASVWELLAPLVTGGRLVLAAPGAHRDPGALAGAVRRHGVTVIQFVPSLLRHFLAWPEAAACRSLRHVFSGGEPLAPDVLEHFAAVLAPLGVQLHNTYGPTEASIDATCWEAVPDSGLAVVPIGRPIRGMEAWVADDRLRRLGPGVPGEIVLAGVGLARGYLGRPDLTAERFRPHPAGSPGARLYRTGDAGRQLADGSLACLGRLDDQVKVGGVRIELGEIEARLRELAGVEDASAAVVGAGEPRLLAWVVGGADPDGCLDALRRVLPPALVPAAVLRLDALPRLPSGKIDRAALPLPDAPAAVEPAETPLQRAIADLWAEVLEVPASDVGLDDDFFGSGGHSLMAMRLVTRLREVFGVGLQLNHLFDGPSVRGLERTLRELEGAPGHADTVADVWLAVAGELEEAARG